VPGSDYFAGNLGISYQLVPYGRAYGARLTGYPNPGSPAAQLQLEPGDMIIQLDNQLIYGPNDVLNHVARTTVVFVNIRTGRPQSGVVYIPSGGGPYPPPQPPPAPYTLGVYVRPVIVYGYSPGQYPQRGLQVLWSSWGGAAARAGVRNGDVIYQADGFAVSTIQAMRSVMARSDGTLELWVFRGGRHNDRQFILVDMRPTTGGGLLRGTPAPEGAPSTTPPPEAAGGTPF
jgi:S1-C subfamily serine protease